MHCAAHILVLYAHPAAHRSLVNRKLAEAARALPGVHVHDLYESYPDFYIDVAREQELVAQADLLVFLHPIQWYSSPALLKEWVDVVFEPGWAYGEGGDALKGKGYWLVVTTGSRADAFRHGEPHDRPFDDFLPQFRQSAALCGMEWQEPLVLHGAHGIDDDAVTAHVAAFRQRLESHLKPAPAGANAIVHPQS